MFLKFSQTIFFSFKDIECLKKRVFVLCFRRVETFINSSERTDYEIHSRIN